jgi:hypothetical protein
MISPHKNTGLILEAPRPRDWKLGGITGTDNKIIREDGDWTSFLPKFESQNRYGMDAMACVSFSFCNVLEIYARATGMGNLDFSDRALAWASNTKKEGNSFWAVWMTARKYGLVPEEMWTWKPDINTWEEYYTAPPEEVEKTAAEFAKTYDVSLEWIDTDVETLTKALQFCPLWVCNKNHAFTLTSAKSTGFETFDHYPFSDGKGRGFWLNNLKLEAAAIIKLIKKQTMPEIQTPNISLSEEALVFEAQGQGRFGLHVKGKLYVDDLTKLLAQWTMRNSVEGKFTGGSTVNLTTSDFNSFPHYDLKNNKLN